MPALPESTDALTKLLLAMKTGKTKLPGLLAALEGVVTVIGPVEAPAGTVAVICTVELTVKRALTPLNFTAVASTRFAPVRVTMVPAVPEGGLKLATDGKFPGGVTEKLNVMFDAEALMPEI